MRCRFNSIALAICTIVLAAPVAAAQRTFVASNGADSNPCSLTQPCRAFAAAIALTSPGGEVIVLDSAGYGPVTIGQAISIIAPPGVYAGISVPAGQNGITVSAGPNDHVILRGLTINGQGGTNGIRITSGQEIHIESCVVSNLTQEGIRIEGGTTVQIADTVVRSNAADGLHTVPGTSVHVHATDSRILRNANYGIYIQSGSFDGSGLTIAENIAVGLIVQPAAATAVTASLADSVLNGNFYGYVAHAPVVGATVRAAAVRVTASRNANAGFESNNGGPGDVTLTVTDSASVGNGTYGITAITGGRTVVSGSTSSGNVGADLYQSTGGIFLTSGNNAVSGRGAADIGGSLLPNGLH